MNKDPYYDSICQNCVFCVKRVIIPLDKSDWDMIEEDIEDTEEDEAMYHVICSIIGIDLDHIVLECNKFTAVKGNNIIFNSNVFGDG